METIEIKILGMTCMHCVKSVEIELRKLPLVEYKVEIGKAIVKFNPDAVSLGAIIEAIEEAGYKVEG
ncbi:MAG TPA: cation transporter [Melioribacteraceae bacterium]|nr:cation transporter [Melioribacteraceae bacterium]